MILASPAFAGDKASESQQAYLAGLNAFQKSDYELARERWEKALALDPKNGDAQAGIQRVDKLLYPNVSKRGRRKTRKFDSHEMDVKLDKLRIGSHKIGISPVLQSEGVQGCFIAYGRPFPTPIKVEPREQLLLVNNVQISPSLLAERQAKLRDGGILSEDQKHYRDRLRQLSDEVMNLHFNAWFFTTTRIRLAFLSYRDVAADVSVTEYGATFTFRETNKTVKWEFPKAGLLSTSPSHLREVRKSNLDLDRGIITGYLTRGGCVLVTATEQIISVKDPHEVVNETMGNAKLSREQKIEALEGIGGYGTALDIIENYSGRDWRR